MPVPQRGVDLLPALAGAGTDGAGSDAGPFAGSGVVVVSPGEDERDGERWARSGHRGSFGLRAGGSSHSGGAAAPAGGRGTATTPPRQHAAGDRAAARAVRS